MTNITIEIQNIIINNLRATLVNNTMHKISSWETYSCIANIKTNFIQIFSDGIISPIQRNLIK